MNILSRSVMLSLCTAFLFMLVPVRAADGDEKPGDEKPKKAYLLFKVRTQLQKDILFEQGERYHLLVHGDGLLDDKGHIDTSLLNFDDLTKDTFPRFILQGDKVDAQIILEGEHPEATRDFLQMAVMGWAREMGYERHVPSSIGGGRVWADTIKIVGDRRGYIDEEETEDAIGDDKVKVYPVRTRLSRLRTADDDCVVIFQDIFDKDTTARVLDEKTKAKIKELVDSLRIKELDQVSFTIKMTRDANRDAVSAFEKAVIKELPSLLGVKNFSFGTRYE
jgi:hypothetical protein